MSHVQGQFIYYADALILSFVLNLMGCLDAQNPNSRKPKDHYVHRLIFKDKEVCFYKRKIQVFYFYFLFSAYWHFLSALDFYIMQKFKYSNRIV